MERPFGIKWKLGELLEREGATLAQLEEVLGDFVGGDTLRGWLGGRPERVELEAFGYLLWGLSRLSGREYRLEDVLEYEILIVGA